VRYNTSLHLFLLGDLKKMEHIYTGVFFDPSELDDLFARHIGKAKLSNVIENSHVTFTYKPKDVRKDLLGKPVRFRVIGYACDGKNQGLQVEVLSIHSSLLSEYDTIKVPHITISVSEDGKPVDTGKLRFEPIPIPFEIVGTYGVFTNDGVLFAIQPKITVSEFCLHKTGATELCAICDGGWIVGTVWIDHEDIFRIPDSLKDRIVKSDYWGELTIVNENGESMRIPAHFIDT
jgi:hypothetical protein